MNTKRHLTGCVLVVLLLATFPLNASASDGMDMPTAHIEFNQAQGAHMEDIIHLNGSSNVPLRNASWSVVNISGATPTTVISGPYLTTVMPMSDNVFAWNLTVEVSNLDCTCYVSIEIVNDEGQHQHWDILLYVGTSLHRPVFVDEWNQHLSHEMAPMVGQSQQLLVSGETDLVVDVVLAPDSDTISGATAEFCEAPYGVCLESPVNQNIPYELVNAELHLRLDPVSLGITEGVWKVMVSAADGLLRSTGQHHTLVVYDATPPAVDLISEPSTYERVPINFYASAEDGYAGADFSYTWTLVNELGVRRAPTDNEYLAPNHLELNLTSQGVYIVEVAVRDLAGLTSQTSVNFTVINQYPTARISNEGMIFSEDGRLTVEENDGWSISGNLSSDDEPVEYLWVINDDRSWRGISTLNQEHFEKPGTYTIELIVFDDDGATNSTFLELEILADAPNDSASSKAWVGLVFIVVLIGLGVGLSRRSNTKQDLPKWSETGKKLSQQEGGRLTHDDATVEEDEARG